MIMVNPALSSLEEVHRDEYVILHADPRGPMTWFARTAVPFPSLAAAVKSYEQLVQAVDRLGRPGRLLLVDMRQSIGRNDAEFEQLMNRMRPQLYRGLYRIGVLVKTATGALHVQRLAKEDHIDRRVSTSEDELIEYLLSGS